MYVVIVQKFTFAISSPDEFLFSQRAAMLALNSAELGTAIPSVRLSVCHIRRYCVKTTARSTVQIALSDTDSKMCHSFLQTKKYSPGTTPSPEMLAETDPTAS